MKTNRINEEVKYNKVSENEQDFDTVPDNIYATQSGYPVPQNQSLTMEEENPGEEEKNPNETPPEPIPDEGGEEDMERDETVNELQNEIIKNNIEILKSIHTKIDELNTTVINLNTRLNDLDKHVEEVREPTNVEKLVKQKDVSYPYYFNLNDFWKGNWFEKHNGDGTMNTGNTGGGSIRQLPDGTYVADFDNLPKKSFIDIEKSFHDIT